MIAFFFTMPIRRMIPIMPMTFSSVFVMIKRSSAPTPADGSVERIVIGMDVAFIQAPPGRCRRSSSAARISHG